MGKELFNKLKEKIKSGRMTLQELKKINPKLLFKMLLDKVLVKVKAVAFAFAIKVVICCLIVGVILLIFAGIMALIMAILAGLQAVVDGVQYLFIGTDAYVNDGDIEDVRNQLDEMGVDFEEIGYIGAIKLMGGAEDYADYNSQLSGIEDDIVNEFEKLDTQYQADIDAAEEEYKKAQERGASRDELDDLQEDIDDAKEELADYADDNINYYIEEYLEAEKQTSAQSNRVTFSDNKGAVRIKHTDLADDIGTDWWDWWGDVIQGSYDVNLSEDGKFTTDFGDKQVDITDPVYDMYMPWKYPFTFHNETLSPDVGYLVAQLKKYHYTTIYIDVDDILTIHVSYSENDDGDTIAHLEDVEWIDDDDMEYEVDDDDLVRRKAMVLPYSVDTWASKVKYKYYYTGTFSEVLQYDWILDDPEESGFNWASKLALGTCFTASDDDIIYRNPASEDNGKTIGSLGFRYLGEDGDNSVYYKRFTLEGEDNHDVEEVISKNDEGYNAMKSIMFPVPIGETDGTVSNYNEVPKYYTANAGEKDKDGKYTGRPALINIQTNAESIIEGVDEIYRNDTDQEMLKGDTDSVTKDEYIEVSQNTAPFVPDMSIKMVADIVELFNDEGVIDMATYFGSGVTEMFANMDTVWFLQQDETRPDCYTLSGTVATITADAGTVVVSPITGEVETVTDNGDGTKTIILTKYGKSDPDDPNSETVPVMKIVLGNVSGLTCTVGQKVTAGSTRIGIVSASGKITYEHLEGSGSPINPKDELDKMISIINLEFAPALPSEYTKVTSWFGPRKPPTSGASSNHKGIDLAAPTGTPIYAIADGTASSAYQQGGYGNYVVVDHGNGYRSEYGHMSKIIVRSGNVKKGDVIGLVGSTGASTGPHLHLTIKYNGTAINPLEDAGLNVFYGETKSNY